MSVLTSRLRAVLERAVGDGRSAAEAAATGALSRLGVADSSAPTYLTADELALREGLLARAMQLGDPRSGGSVDVAVPLLVGEVAYEQWHRLLFARFLAENGLLIYQDLGAPVSLDECEELAASLNEPDGWSVAARFASQILPGIFRLDDPAVLVQLAPEDRLALEKIVTALPAEVFSADDALGWVYQYWQSKQKKLVNDSGRKIGGADISPVTQLFTEDYMVRFLLENSLGAWWASRYPHSSLIAGWDYLRFDEDGAPVAGSFDGWPATIDRVTVMDPCCGSGHFLVAAFGMLWRMRAEAEGLTPADAQDAVLRDNLFGLELDPRCTQIAMFNLALEAWKQGGYRELPVPKIACSGIPAKAPIRNWTVLANGDPRLEDALTRLHELFKDADTLGSLIDPRSAAFQDDLLGVDWDSLSPLLQQALSAEGANLASNVFGSAAAGIAHAADLLSRRYTLITTNPPYLGSGKQAEELQQYLVQSLPAGKADLATAFIQRSLAWATSAGVIAVVTPQNWFLQAAYKQLRADLMSRADIPLFASLGEEAFEYFGARGPRAVLTLIRSGKTAGAPLHFVDASSSPGKPAVVIAEKMSILKTGRLGKAYREESAPHRILSAEGAVDSALGAHAQATEGLSTGDGERFLRQFWEILTSGDKWVPMQTAPSVYGSEGRSQLVRWDQGLGELAAYPGARIQGQAAWGASGVLVARMRSIRTATYAGALFDKSCVVLIPKKVENLPALVAYCESEEFELDVRAIDGATSVPISSLLSVPFDVERWRDLAMQRFQGGLPKPRSNDPSQWLFSGVVTAASEPLQVAVARLLGFSWPDQLADDLDMLADRDGIVSLPPIAGEASASERLRSLLAASYGSAWTTARLDELLAGVGGATKGLDVWLRDGFFENHSRIFLNRPFIWQIWDGRADGFSVLINYHLLNRKTLEKLTYTTLGWWIHKQKDDAANDVAGAGARLAAAEQLKSKLELILRGEPPYDIYVRWKSLADQPIGWDPDLDDGVRMNIRPFVEAGILRNKFTINWNKDRGTNPDGSERLNDVHYTNAQKQQARGGTA